MREREPSMRVRELGTSGEQRMRERAEHEREG